LSNDFEEPPMMKAILTVMSTLLTGAIFYGATMLAFSGTQPALAQSVQTSPEQGAKPGIAFKGGPGDTPETAVVILGPPNSLMEIQAEYDYLEKKFGRQNVQWELKRQSVLNRQGKVFDCLELAFKDGSLKTVFFKVQPGKF
jgi:hypothetical protein